MDGTNITAVVVGCGGIGYHLAEPLLRMLLPQPDARLYLIDGKAVRTRNLARQFELSDIGENKAKALAARISRIKDPASTVRVIPIDQYLEDGALFEFHKEWFFNENTVVFSGVDSKASRVVFEELFQDRKFTGTFISAGNDEIDGQVACCQFVRGVPQGPMPSEIDPDLLINDGRMPSQIPCDEAVVSEPQHVLGNLGAAITMLGFWYSQFLNTPADNRRFNYAHFNMKTPEVFPSNRKALSMTTRGDFGS